MATEFIKLEYVDDRPIFIPHLESLKGGGVSLPNKTNIIEVNEVEKRNLMKMKNGKKSCWIEKTELSQEQTKE